MNQFKQLISPHVHSDSSSDGVSTIAQIVARNKELGATHVAITEHGNMNSNMLLYKECKKQKLKPILGIELYVEVPDFIKEWLRPQYHNYFASTEKEETRNKKVERKLREDYFHLTVHFKDEIAYKYFCQLTPKMEENAVTKYQERKPRCTIDDLRAISGHITIGSGCVLGGIMRWLLPKVNGGAINRDIAEQMYNIIREIAGEGNFIVEIFPHVLDIDWVKPIFEAGKVKTKGFEQPNPNGDIQLEPNKFVLEMANRYGDPVVISLDSHYTTRDQKVIQDLILGQGKGLLKQTGYFYIMSSDEAAEVFRKTLGVSDEIISKWIENSYTWASKFDNFKITTNDDRWVLPEAPVDFMQKLKQKIDRYDRMDWENQQMLDRLKKEIKILFFNGKINLYNYFDTVEDIANYCKDNHILLNLRGSGGGSLLSYLLGVSGFNPLKHDLSFERFLTEGRIKANTLPDLDIDVSDQEKVFKYLESKYGDNFCRISTDTLLKLKSAIKDADRASYGEVRKEIEDMCKKLPTPPQGTNDQEFVFGYTDKEGNHHPGILECNSELQKYKDSNPKEWDMVTKLLGLCRQKSTHACGTIIADKPVQDYCPIIRVGDTKVTGFGPKSVENAGLIKYDLLNLKTLKDIQGCLDSIFERTGIKIDPWNLPYDQKSFANFAA
jgi:DNA polymerase-3 subunit alpha